MKELARSTIARLLATENITVVQDNVRTASFDVKNRVLTLPSWSDVESYTEDHLIGHEVGHALFTPLDGWHDAVCSKGAAYKSYLNVIEDARIEKLIQRKYPGLRAPFIKSYRKLLKDGFFGGQLKDINQMGLIDRINVYFKCGQSVGVRFDEVESNWLPMIESAETWEEVVAIADALFDKAKEENQQQQEEHRSEEQQEESDDAGSDWGDIGDGESGEEQDGGSDFGDEEEDENLESEEDTVASEEGGMEGSQTDKTLRENIANEIMDKEYATVYNLILDVPKNWSDHIITFKDAIAHLKWEKNILIQEDEWSPREDRDPASDFPGAIDRVGSAAYKDWSAVNKKAVNHMVKEFEMRKSAAEYARASVSKTGVIDTVKMNQYKLTDDIFKKVTILPEGKNHGFIMYLDMSGSMGEYMYETVEQTLLLAHFAKQINVPFRVYGFTSTLNRWSDSYAEYEEGVNHKGYTGAVHPMGCKLIELFSDKMSRSEMTYMSQALLTAYFSTGRRDHNRVWEFAQKHGLSGSEVHRINTDQLLQLGGTPLNHALVLGMPIANAFRASHRIDVLNTILLTDGASHDLESCGGVSGYNFRYGNRDDLITVTCPINNKTYKYKNLANRNAVMTDPLLEMYKEVTGSTIIGYRIESNRTRDLVYTYTQLKGMRLGYDAEQAITKEYRREGWIKIENPIGYDECFILNAKHLGIEDNKMDDLEADASKAKIRGAFKKAQGNTKKTRKMLTDLCARVA